MQGAYVAPPGSFHEGATNADMLQVLAEVLGGPPERGGIYRVKMMQGDPPREVAFIGEYLGLALEQGLNEAGRAAYEEPVMRWAIRNPVLPPTPPDFRPGPNGQGNGSPEYPLLLWPLDIAYIARAEPGDLETPMHYQVEGEPPARSVGRPPVQ